MLTGRRAFDGDDISEVLASVLKTDPDLSVLPADVPPSVRRLLRRCLQRDPRKRLSAIGDARLELDEVEPAAPTVRATAVPRHRWIVATGRRRRHRLDRCDRRRTMAQPSGHRLRSSASRSTSPGSAIFTPPRDATVSIPQFALSPDGRSLAFVAGRPAPSRRCGCDNSTMWKPARCRAPRMLKIRSGLPTVAG